LAAVCKEQASAVSAPARIVQVTTSRTRVSSGFSPEFTNSIPHRSNGFAKTARAKTARALLNTVLLPRRYRAILVEDARIGRVPPKGYLVAKHLGAALGFAIGVPFCLYIGWRGLTLFRTIRQLQVRHISPLMLQRKLRSGRKVAVLDLLDFEQEAASGSPAAIPGAFRIDPCRLRNSPQIFVADDVEIVLYCSSRSDIVSAQVALALKPDRRRQCLGA